MHRQVGGCPTVFFFFEIAETVCRCLPIHVCGCPFDLLPASSGTDATSSAASGASAGTGGWTPGGAAAGAAAGAGAGSSSTVDMLEQMMRVCDPVVCCVLMARSRPPLRCCRESMREGFLQQPYCGTCLLL